MVFINSFDEESPNIRRQHICIVNLQEIFFAARDSYKMASLSCITMHNKACPLLKKEQNY